MIKVRRSWGADFVWSPLLFLSCHSNWQQLRQLTANSKKNSCMWKTIEQYRNEFWNAQPALWSELILKLEHVCDQRYPVLREQWILNPHKIQIWFKLQDQFLPPWIGVARDNAGIIFSKCKCKLTLSYFVRTQMINWILSVHCCNSEARKQAKPEQRCDKDRALDNVSHVTWMTCDIWQTVWQEWDGAFDKVGAWVWQLLYPPQ